MRINRLRTKATNVKASSIMNVAVYPPVISKTLFEKVAIKDPTITVKVIIAMLLEKYFMPKNEDVKAAVMVGQEP